MRDGDGILIDARTTQWYEKGTIPGSESIPFTSFPEDPKDNQWKRILQDFGASPRSDVG
jgi:rhodanese-related sulfurtransferase